MAKKKIQVMTVDDEGSNSNLWSLLEDHGFSVVTATERKTPRYKFHIRRKVSVGANGDRGNGTETNGDDSNGSVANATLQDLYEGTVTLVVISDQRVHKMVNFVDQLRQNPGFRLLLMEATQSKEAVSIKLGLREPTALGPVLLAMEDVSTVEASAEPAAESGEPVLQVTLV